MGQLAQVVFNLKKKIYYSKILQTYDVLNPMTPQAAAIIAVTGLAVLTLLFLAVGRNDTGQQNAVMSPSPSPMLSPTPANTQLIQGNILDVTTQAVEYKNSLVATIESDGQRINLYITPDTRIVAEDNRLASRTYLEEEMTITATGVPIEGGFEAVEVQVTDTTNSPTTSPTPRLSPTPRVTPTPPTE